MASKTLTVNVDADVERRFRRVARATQGGKKKGYLGRALTEAMLRWTVEKEATSATVEAIAMLDEGLELGGLSYTHRDELHER